MSVSGNNSATEGADGFVNAYDATPYPDLSYVNTHPDRLATMAALLGMEPAAVTNCRMLEVGCAAGGNLLPMAATLPNSEFVGIDYSARQIEEGQARIARLGLQNVRLIQRNLMDDLSDLGEFDYIVAHGVYSWVTPDVRDGLLRLCKERLRPNGVAYVSYNTYPGWHITEIVREAMLFHARDAADPAEKVAKARAMLEIMTEHAVENSYGGIFRSYAEFLNDGLKGSSDAFLLHDELEEVNEPVYFRDFVAHARRHGLAYLAEVELREVLPHVFKPETQAVLQEVAGNAVDLEQYMDFLRNRMFRQTLLVHDEGPVQRTLRPEPLYRMYIRSQAQAVPPAEAAHAGMGQFKAKDGATLTTDHAVTRAAMEILAEAYPQAMAFADLLHAARASLPAAERSNAPGPIPDEMALAANLLRGHGYSVQLAQLHSNVPSFVTDVSERPMALPVARFEAETRKVVTNVWHERVSMQPVQLDLLRLLDGTRTRDDLRDALPSLAALPSTELDLHLRWLAHTALLVA